MSTLNKANQGGPGIYTVSLRPCTASVLRFIGIDMPWTVWLQGHRPDGLLRWWNTRIPINHGGGPILLTVRSLEYDLQVPRAHLESILPELEQSGLSAFFMDRPVPDTLTLRGIDDASMWKVLRANGCQAHFFLPHAMEVAVLATPSEGHLNTWLKAGLASWTLRSNGA